MKPILSLDSITGPAACFIRQVPGTILSLLMSENELIQNVVQYFFSSNGKLLRPTLTFLGALIKKEIPENDKALLETASCFEIFHAATLIHDDIIDSAYLRRNLPTINVKWGPELAVLVGDYLYARASETVFSHGNDRVICAFLQTAKCVCDGEIHEVKEKDNFSLTEEEYLEIIAKKTAALLACAVESGGIMAGASAEEAEALKRFGHYFGLAFQVVDDCLDFTGEEKDFGKMLGADCAAGVLTLPLIRLTQLVDERRKSEIFKIFKSEMGTHKFQTLLHMIREYDTLNYSLARAKLFSEKAKLELSVFPDSEAKRSLLSLADFVLERNR